MSDARVIRILDERRLVLNVGSTDGIERHDQWAIYTPTDEIVDPKTKEVLGRYRERKATVEAKVVAERYTIASPPATFTSGSMLNFPSVLGGLEEPKLPGRDMDLQPLPTGSTVKVGDHAVLLRPPTTATGTSGTSTPASDDPSTESRTS